MSDLLLLTPGPVSSPHEVLAAGAKPMLHHRSPQFSSILEEVIEQSKLIFDTACDVLLVHATGRGAMEGALRNLLSPGERVISVCNGKFGGMFADIASIAGLEVMRVFEDWETSIDPDAIDSLLGADPSIRAVTLVHSDTSNGLENPIETMGRVVRRHGRLLFVDCISSLGAMPFAFDDWGVDVAITASQKGLMAPAGVSFVALSPRAWKAAERAQKRSYYIDFSEIKKVYTNKRQTPGSTPVSVVASVAASMRRIFSEGLANVYLRHRRVAESVRAGLGAAGLSLFPLRADARSASVSAFTLPKGLEPSSLRTLLEERYQIMIAGGLGRYSDHVIRIGHIGAVNDREAVLVISAVELALSELGTATMLNPGLNAYYETVRESRDSK